MACQPATCNSTSQRAWHQADRVGATASLLCAIHCALLPLVIGLLPLIGLEILADPGVELVFVLCACVLASTTIVRAWRRYRDPMALRLLIPGVVLLLLGQAVDHESAVIAHAALMACGGTLVASAHVINLRMLHRLRHAASKPPAAVAQALPSTDAASM